MQQITVYTAKAIHTMNPSLPLATAVAVCDDTIIEVGSMESLRPWLDAHPHAIDARFADKVIMPGFIDPHLHPSMAALLLPMHFITAMDWKLPWQDVAAVRGQNAFIDRLTTIENAMSDPEEPLFTWGYHPIWHGVMDRDLINGFSSERPVIIWHRGFHSLVVNDAAVRWMKLDEADLERHPQIDAKTGKFFETGLAVAFHSMNPYLLGAERFAGGMEKLRQCVHHGGQTTIDGLWHFQHGNGMGAAVRNTGTGRYPFPRHAGAICQRHGRRRCGTGTAQRGARLGGTQYAPPEVRQSRQDVH